jgi:hypothetical protein
MKLLCRKIYSGILILILAMCMLHRDAERSVHFREFLNTNSSIYNNMVKKCIGITHAALQRNLILCKVFSCFG